MFPLRFIAGIRLQKPGQPAVYLEYRSFQSLASPASFGNLSKQLREPATSKCRLLRWLLWQRFAGASVLKTRTASNLSYNN
jgi:hypothetical protein